MKSMTSPRLARKSFDTLFSDGVSTGLTDKELLERFANSRDSAGELALATLVSRHGPMVLSICRRMLSDPHESEDAFQAIFLVLVRKRSLIRIESSLGPWLYGVSVRIARRARLSPRGGAGAHSTIRSRSMHTNKRPFQTRTSDSPSTTCSQSCRRTIALRSSRVTSKGSRTKRPPISCGAPSARFAAGWLGAGQS